MSSLRLVAFAMLCATLSACGATAHRVTIGAVAQRTLDAKSARIEATTASTDQRVPNVLRIAGTARFDPERYSFTAKLPEIGTVEVLVFTHEEFYRQRSPARGQTPLFPSGVWCKDSGGVAENGFGFNPTSAISSLRDGGGALERLGSERLRDVDTTHYRVVKTGLPPTEVWVDSNDLLRRIQQTKDDAKDVVDYFDYGVTTAPITVPAQSSACNP